MSVLHAKRFAKHRALSPTFGMLSGPKGMQCCVDLTPRDTNKSNTAAPVASSTRASASGTVNPPLSYRQCILTTSLVTPTKIHWPRLRNHQIPLGDELDLRCRLAGSSITPQSSFNFGDPFVISEISFRTLGMLPTISRAEAQQLGHRVDLFAFERRIILSLDASGSTLGR